MKKLKTIYLELAFWLQTVAGVGVIVLGSLNEVEGVDSLVVLIIGVVIGVANFLGAALLRRAQEIVPTQTRGVR